MVALAMGLVSGVDGQRMRRGKVGSPLLKLTYPIFLRNNINRSTARIRVRYIRIPCR